MATQQEQLNQSDQFSGSNYADLEDYLQKQIKASQPETPEQEKKRKRREKWEGVISGISDMGMALSNLFFTSQYAPNMYDASTGMSVKASLLLQRQLFLKTTIVVA